MVTGAGWNWCGQQFVDVQATFAEVSPLHLHNLFLRDGNHLTFCMMWGVFWQKALQKGRGQEDRGGARYIEGEGG